MGNKSLRFGVRFKTRFGTLLGAVGPPLGDFWRTLAALGVTFWNVCCVVDLVSGFGEDLEGFLWASGMFFYTLKFF